MTDGSKSSSPPPTFESLEALAYVEIDRFCASCAYNLRGQPVRRETNTQVLMCRCPECGSFTPANDTSVQLDSWRRRGAKLLWGGWILICLYLLIGACGAMTGAMIGVVDELRWIDYRWESTSPTSPEQTALLNERVQEHGQWIRMLGLLGIPMIGLIAGMLWPVIFPHWRRRGYALLAVLHPTIALCIVIFIVSVGELRVPYGEEWLLIAIPVGLIIMGLFGTFISRYAARSMLTVLLPAKQRAIFSYLWMVDGKKPPSAKE